MIVFTNGCFDILHPGHIELLKQARALGDKLIVGINSDRSVRAIKGEGRPLQDQDARRAVLMGLESVDDVIVFDELTPERVIKEIQPDVLVKGGDWQPDEIIGADIVRAKGGKVVSIPLVEGFSTSAIANSFAQQNGHDRPSDASTIEASLVEHAAVFDEVRKLNLQAIRECFELISNTFESGGKILICGNGGSAADAQHLAAEFVGRYEAERKGLPAIALTTDTSALTALANDYDFERVFTRQVEALAREGDCLVAISTSGNSRNVISAVMKARGMGCKIVGLTGAAGKKLASLCDACVLVPSERTARIQEAHITIAHIWCEMIDEKLLGST